MLITLQEAINEIKSSIEGAILKSGTLGKNNLIKTQKPIKLIHEVVKSELINKNIRADLIKPLLNDSNGELTLSGFLKNKDQDICVVPKSKIPIPEVLKLDGILKGTNDKYGHMYTESCLSINIRSQLSSSAKNFDTLYERTFAEALNLHLRCPKMVLGEVYMIAVNEYDSNASNKKQIGFKNIKKIDKHIEKYLMSFSAINMRKNTETEHYKYERTCLLVVDFSKDIPKIYNTDDELREDGLLPSKTYATIKNLCFPNFINDITNVYIERFGDDIFN